MLKEPDVIARRPVLDELPVSNAVDGNCGFLHVCSSGGEPTGKFTDVLAVRREPGDDLVAIGELILDLVAARRRLAENAKRLLQPVPT